MSNNSDRLVKNKQRVTEVTEEFLASPSSAVSKENLEEKLVGDFTSLDGLTAAIETLAELKDKKNNITWHRSKGFEPDNTPVLIRDGRGSTSDGIVQAESYYIQHLNHIRAAIMIAEQALKDPELTDTKTLLFDKAKLDYSSLDKKQIKQLNTEIANILINKGIEDAPERTKTAKDFAGFKDTHYHITTISELEGTAIVESDVMNLGLTDIQKKIFTEINAQDDLNVNLTVKEIDMDWYNKMPIWKKQLIKDSTQDILSEKKVIPTQLRKELPLVRNSYTKLTQIKKADKKLKTVLETMHSGTLSIATEGDNLVLTGMTVDQLQEFLPDDQQSVTLNPLTSPINTKDIDAKENNLLNAVIDGKQNIDKATTPFNFLRKLPGGGGRDFSGYQNIIKELVNNLDDNEYKYIKNYLDGKGTFKEAEEYIKKLLDPKVKNALENAILAKQKMDSISSTIAFDSEHMHSQITSHMKLLSSSCRNGDFGNDLKTIPIINTNCASGKDRTGMQETDASLKAICQELEIVDILEQKKILLKMAKSGHTAHIAGTQGGTPGCFGVRPSTVKTANQSLYKETAHLFGQKTAEMNKFAIDKTRINTGTPAQSDPNGPVTSKSFQRPFVLIMYEKAVKLIKYVLEKITKTNTTTELSKIKSDPKDLSTAKPIVSAPPPTPGKKAEERTLSH